MCNMYSWKKAKHIRGKPIFWSERMLYKDYNQKGSVAPSLLQKNWSWVSRVLTPRWTDWQQTAGHKETLTLNMKSVQSRQLRCRAVRWYTASNKVSMEARGGHHWKLLPNKDKWRHSKLRTVYYSDLFSVYISDSTTTTSWGFMPVAKDLCQQKYGNHAWTLNFSITSKLWSHTWIERLQDSVKWQRNSWIRFRTIYDSKRKCTTSPRIIILYFKRRYFLCSL
jgi:hypothetical protein